jgi:hypothetical protein
MMRMNAKLRELTRVLIENGQNWLCFISCEDDDIVSHVNDYFYDDGFEYTIIEINWVCIEMKKRLGCW